MTRSVRRPICGRLPPASLRKHIRTNHRDLYRQLELCESLTQQTSCSDTRGGGVAVTSSIDEATSLGSRTCR